MSGYPPGYMAPGQVFYAPAGYTQPPVVGQQQPMTPQPQTQFGQPQLTQPQVMQPGLQPQVMQPQFIQPQTPGLPMQFPSQAQPMQMAMPQQVVYPGQVAGAYPAAAAPGFNHMTRPPGAPGFLPIPPPGRQAQNVLFADGSVSFVPAKPPGT